MVVYIDLIFLTNLLIDWVLLFLTAWMQRQRPKWWRMVIAAVIGALYVVMMFVPELTFLYTFLIKFGLSLLMIWTSFGFHSLQSFMKTIGSFYVINFVAAGGILGLHYLLQSSGELFNGILFTTTGGVSFELQIGFWFMFIVFFCVLFIFRAVHKSKKKADQMTVFFGEVNVRIGEVEVSCTGLVDTGNQLTDPLTRTPVMVMEATLWDSYLPETWKGRISQVPADQLVMELGDGFEWQDRLRLIPFRGINKGTSFMLAIKPDSVMIKMNGTCYTPARTLIGLDGGTLSSEGKYRAIIHPEYVQDPIVKPSSSQTEKPLNVV
ncbi:MULTISPECIES: sigma-E processing peptidase SpoIIGA [unclassified Paenibacillus]|uniref:Sigma-E processing peptidase SpoIIGA n=1 Tax=Paenibacillus provencensis TaxID=441151 RepID=A0ABW3PHF1_9BACL|nr:MULTISPECIES: sigma-E processing peptidase SpoIIGA [unclassified Paenibacillus]MCM3126267.1 sigma-E processing peptidase SpoIIGA [Paenibacillus sp. MER 78]